jgi:hypothetical protein
MCKQRTLSLKWKEDGNRYVGKEFLSAQSSVRYYIFNVGEGKDRRAVLCRERHYVYGEPPIKVDYLVEPPCEEYTREELVAMAELDFDNLEDVRYHNKFELQFVKEYIANCVTLSFSKSHYGDGSVLQAHTEIGEYEIEYSGGAYSILTPDEEYPQGVYNDINSAMNACTEHFKNTLVRAIEEGVKHQF